MNKSDKIFSQILGWVFILSLFASIWFRDIRFKLLATAFISLVSGILFCTDEEKKGD